MKIFKFLSIIALAAFCSCDSGEVKLLSAEKFQKEIDGKKTDLYTLKNDSGMVVQLTNYGARVVSLWAPDRDGNFRDVVVGMGSIDGYLKANDQFYGATVGRYGNRIANGRFTIDGKEYQLDLNDGKNHLHGGSKGLYSVIWDGSPYKTMKGEDAVVFQYKSPDGEMGYPGNLDLTVRYILGEDNSLRIYYQTTTDSTTILNLTHHSYFNLNGVDSETTINDHQLKINGSRFTPTDSTLIPTGELAPVAGTPFDFTSYHAIGERVDADNIDLKIAGGYDHNWVLDYNTGVMTAAEVYSPESGIMMTVLTDEPGMQFYGGNFMKGVDNGKFGKMHKYREAFCLETQRFPDSPNHPEFPTTELKAGDTRTSVCYYYFTVKE